MKGLFRREGFSGLGRCPLLGKEPDLTISRTGRAARLRSVVRREAPRVPGVYGMLDANEGLIYVGKAKSLRSRLMSYFHEGRDEKAGRIVGEARRLVWEPAFSEFAALLRELHLIRLWKPRWNVAGQPRRQRRMYVCLGRRPAPHAFTVARPPSTAAYSFGPFPGMRRTREAVNRLNDWFRLRDCPRKQTMHFAGQGELFPVARVPGCLRHEIGNCLAPCAAACTQGEYAFHVEAALGFLQGRDNTPLEHLQRRMEEASAALQFERAAALRDRLSPLEWMSKHLARLREARALSGIYPVTGHDGAERWYAIRHGVVKKLLPPGDTEAALAALADGPAEAGLPGLNEVDGMMLVLRWFRHQRGEREKLLGAEALSGAQPPASAGASPSGGASLSPPGGGAS